MVSSLERVLVSKQAETKQVDAKVQSTQLYCLAQPHQFESYTVPVPFKDSQAEMQLLEDCAWPIETSAEVFSHGARPAFAVSK